MAGIVRVFARFVIFASISAAFLLAQAFRVAPSHTDLQTPGVFSLTLDAPAGKTPVALQWEFWVPPVIAISPADITISPEAESARKSLTCAARTNKPDRQRGTRFTCVLAGGKNPIENGPIASIHYRAQWDTKGVPVRVSVEDVLGVSADLKRIPILGVDQIIDIH